MSSPAPETTTPGLAAVRSWCGWHIAPSRTETLRVEGEGSPVLLLPSLFVTDVTEVRNEDGVVQSGYKWRRNGVVRGNWACEDLYALDVVHGHDAMPTELQAIIDKIDADGLGSSVTRHSAGPFSTDYGSADLASQPITVRAVIARYKLPLAP